jgi:hypothetical protein
VNNYHGRVISGTTDYYGCYLKIQDLKNKNTIFTQEVDYSTYMRYKKGGDTLLLPWISKEKLK